MSLRPEPTGEVPAETARVTRAACPKGTVATRLRDEFSVLYEDEEFCKFYPARGQPGLAPWRLALITVFQFLKHLSDRQAADALRARIAWKSALDEPDVPAEPLEVWRVHYARDNGPLRWRSAAELPPVAERMQSPHDPAAHFSMKRQLSWTGYKVHVAETCDDNAAHLITHVKTCLSMQPDVSTPARNTRR